MSIIKTSAAYTTLVFLSIFLLLNIMYINDGGVGYLFFGAYVLFFLVNLCMCKQFYVFLRIKKSLLIFGFFIGYLILNYAYDNGGVQGLSSIITGTTGGLVFGLVSGLIASHTLSIVYSLRVSGEAYKSVFYYYLLYSSLLLLMALYVFLFHYSNVRSDIFLISNNLGNYQRAGNFIFMQFMVIAALSVVIVVTQRKPKSAVSFFCAIILITLGLVFALLSQLIASNSGLATVIGFLLVTCIYFFVLGKGIKVNNINLTSVFFGFIGKRIFIGTVFSVLLLYMSALCCVYLFDLNFSSFRITGFESDAAYAFTDRFDLVEENFSVQLQYSPVLGNTQVDDLTTGSGTYAHSLVSIATHLGFVGVSIFLVFLYQIYFELTAGNINSTAGSIYLDTSYSLFRLFGLGAVLIFALISAFYTWLPLWFAIGFFGVSLAIPSQLTRCIMLEKKIT